MENKPSLITRIEKSSFYKLIIIIGDLTILITLLSYLAGAGQRRRDELMQAWQLLSSFDSTQFASGGRKEALETLNSTPRMFPLFFSRWEREELNDINLYGVNLEGINLENAVMYRANLQGVNFRNATLREIKLDGSDLDFSEFQSADLTMASLIEASLKEVDLFCTDLSDSVLKDADIENSDLKFANLSGSNLEGAQLNDANLFASNLEQTNLLFADISGANLQYANLASVDLRTVRGLSDANLRNASYNSQTKIPEQYTYESLGMVPAEEAEVWESCVQSHNVRVDS